MPASRGNGKSTVRPDGDRTITSSTICHDGTAAGDESERLVAAQRARGQPVAAALVAGEAGPVDEHDVAARRAPG